MTNIQPTGDREIKTGAPVQIIFEKRGSATVLPQAKIATKTED